MRTAAATLIVAVVASVAIAQGPGPSAATGPWEKEPDGYRGLKWGTPVAASAEILDTAENCLCVWGSDDHALCKAKPEKDRKKVPPRRVCFTSFNVGSVKVKDHITFANDALAGASMSFDTDDYEKMRDIFIDKYGQPASRKASEVQNRMGAAFQQEELDWRGNAVSVSLSRYGSKLTEGSAYIMTNAFRDQIQAEAEAEKKEGAKAF